MKQLNGNFKYFKMEICKPEKRKARQEAVEKLKAAGFDYISLSDTHLRIKLFDFWPTTGLYKNRVTGERGQGVDYLLKELKK